ncbi:MAG: Sua5/YciO/YrdC/YwlC family protein, partial [archaeon]
QKPFSVIAPSKEWILENCVVGEADLTRLPGPYTLILKLKQKCVAENVNLGLDTLGVRIPDNWFSQLIKETGIPIVTTSVNLTGQKFMTSLDSLDPKIKDAVDFIVYEGPLRGSPSEIINLTTGEISR